MIQNKFEDLKYPENVLHFLNNIDLFFKVIDNRHEANLNLDDDHLLG